MGALTVLSGGLSVRVGKLASDGGDPASGKYLEIKKSKRGGAHNNFLIGKSGNKPSRTPRLFSSSGFSPQADHAREPVPIH
jgi:hypothetical protein